MIVQIDGEFATTDGCGCCSDSYNTEYESKQILEETLGNVQMLEDITLQYEIDCIDELEAIKTKINKALENI